MRIICPDCEAQYEVPEEAIPPEGRDVQCSNCNTTWFCEHPEHPGTARLDRDGRDGLEAETEAPGAQDVPGKTDAPIAPGVPLAEEHGDNATAVPELPRRELDPKVASILREEARREAEARRAEHLETQPDLGLTEGARPQPRAVPNDTSPPAFRAQPARADRPAGREAQGSAASTEADGRDQTPQADSGPTAAAARSPRRDVLPDVEEINSSLRARDAQETARDHPDPRSTDLTRRRRGFRRGFLAAVVIFLVGVLVYRFAPDIAEALPQADPWLSNYVNWADETRAMLDLQVRNLLAWLDELTATAP